MTERCTAARVETYNDICTLPVGHSGPHQYVLNARSLAQPAPPDGWVEPSPEHVIQVQTGELNKLRATLEVTREALRFYAVESIGHGTTRCNWCSHEWLNTATETHEAKCPARKD